MSKDYDDKDTMKYHATYERPQRPDANVITRIGRLNPVAHCLDQVLEEWMQEQSYVDTDETRVTPRGGVVVAENIKITQQFRNDAVDKFTNATFDAFCHSDDNVYSDQKRGQVGSHSGGESTVRQDEPPAALLHGKVKYYNRFGGQWRIVVSDAEIRSRVNVDYSRLKKSDNRSLKEMHCIQMAKDSALTRPDVSMNHQPEIDSDGVFKIDGDLVILACDDL
mmetsp:Transcript_6377/g.12025  ORF Transcript_6377/g.12025 Transcript_6377/m.12025 type:complete len:222 (+) Transcript_6377:161-826(+)